MNFYKFINGKATSPSKRHYFNIYLHFEKKFIFKRLLLSRQRAIGRNYKGTITIRHKSSFNKKLYRKIKFNYSNQQNITGITFNIEYDPFRNAQIASIFNIQTKFFFYIISPKNLKIGNIIKLGKEADNKLGHIIPLKKVVIGYCISVVSAIPNSIGKFARAAGTYCFLLYKKNSIVKLILPSSQKLLVSIDCFCMIGSISNEFYFIKQLGKAGRSRWLGNRPTVRGVAMNSFDHANGGGNGKKSSFNKTPWGKLNK